MIALSFNMAGSGSSPFAVIDPMIPGFFDGRDSKIGKENKPASPNLNIDQQKRKGWIFTVFEIIQGAVSRLLGAVVLSSQLDTIIVIVAGLLQGERASIAGIGENMPGEATEKSKKNRVFRFVCNPRVNVEFICGAIVGGLGMRGKRIVVATDWTEIGPLSVLTSAVIINGRAIPIYWTVVDTLRTRKRAVEVEHMLRLSQILIGVDAIHVLDRGFDGGDFLAAIGKFCKYVVRLSNSFCYRQLGECDFKNINDFKLKRGRRHDLDAVEYTKSHLTRCRLVVFHDHQQKEPWLLTTNRYGDKRAVIIGYYATRFRIEESFKDLKDLRSGFALHGYRMQHTEHLSRLLAVVAVGYLLMNASGHYGEENGVHRRLQINTRKTRELAIWRVGLYLIKTSGIGFEEILRRLSALPLCLNYCGDNGDGQSVSASHGEEADPAAA